MTVDYQRVGLAVNEAISLVDADELRPDWAQGILDDLTHDEELAFMECLRDISTTYHSGRKTTYWNAFQRHLEYYD